MSSLHRDFSLVTSTAPSSIRQIVVSSSATGNIFFPLVYWKVSMDIERRVAKTSLFDVFER